MPSILNQLPRTVLDELASALSSGRIHPPYSGLALREWLAGHDQGRVSEELERFRAAGMTPAQIGIVMDLLAAERARQQSDHDRIQMVWTGPDQEGPSARDTGVVARELLAQASRSLFITTFSVSRDATTFEPVSEAMRRNNDLDVTPCAARGHVTPFAVWRSGRGGFCASLLDQQVALAFAPKGVL
jgi:hypothetical protein